MNSTTNQRRETNRKKRIIVGTALVGILGGIIFAQGVNFGSAENPISAAEAKKIALKTYNGTIVEFDYDIDDSTPHYEFEIKKGTKITDVYVDAITGDATITGTEVVNNNLPEKIEDKVDAMKSNAQIAVSNATKGNAQKSNGTVQKDSETANASVVNANAEVISKSEAIKIANTVASGTVVKVELDKDDNVLTYDIELRDGNQQYDVEIDAYTGQVIDFESDIDND